MTNTPITRQQFATLHRNLVIGGNSTNPASRYLRRLADTLDNAWADQDYPTVARVVRTATKAGYKLDV